MLRIGGLYTSLCEVGEIKYLVWTSTFQNSKTGSDALLDKIKKCCGTMEMDLKKWRKSIDDNRKNCYLLNLFTMKQILKLRKELASACTGHFTVNELPLQVYALLEIVRGDVDALTLASALQAALPQSSCRLDENAPQYFSSDESDDDELVEDDESEVRVLSTSVRDLSARARKSSKESFNDAKETLEAMGYPEDTIIASLRACGRGASEDELVAWVVSNADDSETIKTLFDEVWNDHELSDLLEDFSKVDSDDTTNIDGRNCGAVSMNEE